MMTGLVENHHLVLFRPSAELFARTLRESFYKHIELLALVFLVLLGRNVRLQGDEFVQSANLLFLRYVVGQML